MFDGDESNVYIIRTLETEAEAMVLMNTKTCIMSSQRNAPGIGLFYDAITGIFQLTRKETDFKIIQTPTGERKIPYFTPSEFDSILRDVTNRSGLTTLRDRLKKHKIPEYSGKAVFSAILPDNFNYKGNNGVEIRDGVLISGQLTVSNVSTKDRAIQQFLYKWYGMDRASDFITDATRIAYNYLEFEPVTVGILSCIAENKEMADKNDEGIRRLMAKGQFFVDDQPTPKSLLEKQKQEEKNTMKLSVIADFGRTDTMKILGKKSGLVIMAEAGTKGDGFNAGQIGSALGQQNIAGLRLQIDKTLERCLSYFPPGSKNIEHQGFCSSSFLEGTNVHEMFFMQQAAREGLLDTTTKTAAAGYKHNQTIKYFEDHIVFMDGSVRTGSTNEVIMFQYAEHGMDPKNLILVSDGETGVSYPCFTDPNFSADMINTEFGF
jgi:DNA-directed RNA polymerase beta' subunit